MQKDSDVEYIVIDGGSTDGSVEMIDKYKDKICHFVSEPDKGIYDAMNKGLKLATGEMIAFLNAGDFYASETVISQVAAAMQETDCDAAYGDLKYVAKDNPAKTLRVWKSYPYVEGLFEKGWHPPHPAFFVKKHIFEKYGYFDLRYNIAADYELMLRFIRKYRIKSLYIPEVLVKMRIGGKSNKNLWRIIEANIECYRAWKKNGLNVSPFIMLKKPASKLIQYVKRG
jgi:glycosyltransferase